MFQKEKMFKEEKIKKEDKVKKEKEEEEQRSLQGMRGPFSTGCQSLGRTSSDLGMLHHV